MDEQINDLTHHTKVQKEQLQKLESGECVVKGPVVCFLPQYALCSNHGSFPASVWFVSSLSLVCAVTMACFLPQYGLCSNHGSFPASVWFVSSLSMVCAVTMACFLPQYGLCSNYGLFPASVWFV